MTLDRSWEPFNAGPLEPYQRRLHATINNRGTILLNKNLHEMLGRPEGVQLFYNREKDTIGLKPSNPRLAVSFPFRVRDGAQFIIHASPFCRHFGIRPDGTEKFIDPQINNDGVLMLSLKKTVRLTGPTRRRKPRNSES